MRDIEGPVLSSNILVSAISFISEALLFPIIPNTFQAYYVFFWRHDIHIDSVVISDKNVAALCILYTQKMPSF